jgi:dihydropteroate synthase
MHMQGEPRTMQHDPRYGDVVVEVRDFLMQRAHAALDAGVGKDRIWLDPGIGFGKRLEHNLALLNQLDQICGLGLPVVLGVSRKRFVHYLDPSATEATDRLGGSLAAALIGADRGAAVLRVHEVRETAQALAVRAAILQAAPS